MVYGGVNYLNISKYYIYITLLIIIINIICIAPIWNASQSALQQRDNKHQVLHIKGTSKNPLKKSM